MVGPRRRIGRVHSHNRLRLYMIWLVVCERWIKWAPSAETTPKNVDLRLKFCFGSSQEGWLWAQLDDDTMVRKLPVGFLYLYWCDKTRPYCPRIRHQAQDQWVNFQGDIWLKSVTLVGILVARHGGNLTKPSVMLMVINFKRFLWRYDENEVLE